MNKLLCANFSRLRKNKAFWICIIAMAAISVLMVIGIWKQSVRYDTVVFIDNIFFSYASLCGIVCAAFISLYLGTEYSDGTMRNKLVIGHKRTDIYLANFITASAAGILICLSYILIVCVMGIPLFGFFKADAAIVLIHLLLSFLMVIAMVAVFTLLSMLNQNKAVVSVISIIGIFALLLLASYIASRLDEPEYTRAYVMSEDSDVSGEDLIPNPRYLSGSKRDAYQFLLEFLPTGQALIINNMSAQHWWQMALCSLSITAAATAGGICAFRRKDIK